MPLLLLASLAFGQTRPTTSTSRPRRLDQLDRSTGFHENPQLLAAFRPVVSKVAPSVVYVLADGKPVALGAIVGADGWILTKNSQLAAGVAPMVRLRSGRILEARVVGVHDRCDLAMLKIEALGLPAVTWGDPASAGVGALIATCGAGADPLYVGVVGVAARSVKPRDLPPSTPPANAGFLGVGLEEFQGGARIQSIAQGSAAEKAGLRIGDIVIHIDDTPVIDAESMVNTIQHKKPGDTVTIQLMRGEREMQLQAVLGKRPVDSSVERRDRQNRMGGELSARRGGFPAILQHDMPLRPEECGGPVVDLSGNVIGLNIARAGRTETYVLPATTIQPLIEDLKAGKIFAATRPTTRPSTAPTTRK